VKVGDIQRALCLKMKGVDLDDFQEVVQLRRICISPSTQPPGCQAISTEYDVLDAS
jgi:hypothetical protein